MQTRPRHDFLNAIKTGKLDAVIKHLQSAKVYLDEVNIRDSAHTPALVLALMHNQFDVAKILLDYGADASLADKNGVTGLMLTARSGNVGIIDRIVKSRVKTSAVYNGLNAVEMAALNGHREVVSTLLRNGAYIQCQDLYQQLTKLEKFTMISLIDQILEERLDKLGIYHLELTPQIKSMILGLSKNNLKRFIDVIENLETSKQLTQENIAAVLQVILKKNPTIKLQQYLPATEADPINRIGEWQFYSDKKMQNSGGMGLIYHGYASAQAAVPRIPDFLIKVFKLKGRTNLEVQLEAVREAKYLNLAGRRAAIAPGPKRPVMITEWQRGECLDTLIEEKHNIGAYPLHKRLKWLTSALTDLDNLHANFRIHSDIKPLNCVLDLQTDVMRLIDFGAAHKPDTPKGITTTMKWVDPNEGRPQKMASDMYMMGHVIGSIFPELFDVKEHQIPVRESRSNETLEETTQTSVYLVPLIEEGERTHAEQVIYAMVSAMQDKMATMRCSSQQALACCQLMLQKINLETDDISAEDFSEILDATINRDYFVVDDALRDTRRPELFRIPDEVMHSAESALSNERKKGEKYSDTASTLFQPGEKKRRKIDPDDELSSDSKISL